MAEYVLKIKDKKLADIVFSDAFAGLAAGAVTPGDHEFLADNLLTVLPHLQLADSLIDCKNIVYALLNLLIQTGVDIYKQALRVEKITGRFAVYLGLTAKEREHLQCASLLHDLGMLGLDLETRTKAEPLTPAERQLLGVHPVLSYRILAGLDFCPDMMPLLRSHHERPDGTGYPDRLAGEAIPLGARIIAIADAFDAMTSQRPYRREVSTQLALQELGVGSGAQFDRHLVQEFAGFIYSKFWRGKGLWSE